MIYVGIDVAKDKHDCFITNSDGEVLFKAFTFSNNREGFENLFPRVQKADTEKIRLSCFVKLQKALSVLTCLPSL